MSNRKNYSKMYNNPEQETPEAETEAVEAAEIPETPETPAVAEEKSTEKKGKAEKVVEAGTKAEVTYKSGVIANCEKLNIRINPSLKANVLFVMPKGTKVEFQPVKNNDEWVFVAIGKPSDGTNGFCMKKYIKELK